VRRRALVLAATCGLLAGCGSNGNGAPGYTGGGQTIPGATMPGWVPRSLQRAVQIKRDEPCGVLVNGRSGLYELHPTRVSCSDAVRVVRAFDAGLRRDDITGGRCNYELCPPRVRSVRGFRCRLISYNDDDASFACRDGRRSVGFGTGD
jgi:hypothetical protein